MVLIPYSYPVNYGSMLFLDSGIIYQAVPNVDTVNRYADSRSAPGAGNFMSVSSSSYSSSSNVNGEVKNSRGAETVVNDNGRVTRYKVQS
ncbi:hypothetical protein O3G_MSEX013649 [Manduca sexta]|uniref:Uncharacterized protein n=1 Tax=Manduca sexta TaxID=7130 RepID=A0A921ZRU9_MANSE|nr:hypothetical protein O3G_MSEX013649 [Manduca sexta]KAG6463077.1 hypothetical protein O3G_MSEX013649 [Manduca sexta]